MLGGALSPDVSHARNTVALNEAAERLTAVAELAAPLSRRAHHLFRRLRARWFSTSGRRRSSRCGCSRAWASRRAGSSPRTSRATRSRTRGSRASIAQPKPGERWLLVTSAYHLPRSVGVFRKAGFPVEAYPVDWRTRGTGDALRPFPTLGDGLRRTDTAVREWVGLVAYWLTGHSSELFPGPIRRGECDRAGAASTTAGHNCANPPVRAEIVTFQSTVRINLAANPPRAITESAILRYADDVGDSEGVGIVD